MLFFRWKDVEGVVNLGMEYRVKINGLVIERIRKVRIDYKDLRVKFGENLIWKLRKKVFLVRSDR